MFSTSWKQTMKFGSLALILALGLAGAAHAARGPLDVTTGTVALPDFSTAGFFQLPNSGRDVLNFNVGWRFFKANAPGAEQAAFDDSKWEVVNAPHGLELLPSEASGCVNYQGPAWYRKHFTIPASLASRKLSLHFEAIMGKSKVWVNGKLAAEHFGGYLPIIIDLTGLLRADGSENIISVWTDNSDDPTYPPGKPEKLLDFTYCGGIYRDVWLIATAPVHVTDANFANQTAGGGVFARTVSVSDTSATVAVKTQILNESATPQSIRLQTVLKDAAGRQVAVSDPVLSHASLAPGASTSIEQILVVPAPALWTPDAPHLYNLVSTVVDASGATLDGLRTRIGIRTIEFRGRDGLYLNNKPYNEKLIGANRHQDFAYVGNALPNTGQWRDVKKLRDAGMRIVRSAHYPQDPAFMDACDELGMFITVATPGWQFFNRAPEFSERVYSDIRNMVRRDRNHPAVILWEPILNETSYPAAFAQKVAALTHEEYPYPGCYAAADSSAAGSQNFDVLYGTPAGAGGRGGFGRGGAARGNAAASRGNAFAARGAAPAASAAPVKTYFTREWGDDVDDWSSHNSRSRVARSWGEYLQLEQAWHYSRPPYSYICMDRLYQLPRQSIGGALWCAFDCQRGYHADPFWGGVMDMFRQPKYSYYAFQAQRDPALSVPKIDGGPMIFIANEMTPFSPADAVVFTNCEQVHLTAFGRDLGTTTAVNAGPGIPHPPVVFKNAYSFEQQKRMSSGRSEQWKQAAIVAEGLIGGKVVVTSKRLPAAWRSRIILTPDFAGSPLVADGSDFVPVIASMVDRSGMVKRLGEDLVQFTVEGEGSVIGDASIGANPRHVEWGTAPALIRATTHAGKIKIIARTVRTGAIAPAPAELIIESVPAPQALLYKDVASGVALATPSAVPAPGSSSEEVETLKKKLDETQRELDRLKLREVERQQEEFNTNKPLQK